MRIGVAIGEREVTAVVLGSARPAVTVPLTLPAEGEDPTAALASAFRAVHEQLADGAEGVRVERASVALLPPLSDTRLIALPPLRRAEAEVVVRRDAARHFLGGTGARVVAVRIPPRNGRRANGDGSAAGAPPVLAVAARTTLVEAVRTAARRAGWTPGAIVGAHAAWLDGSQHSNGTAAVVAVNGETAYVMRSAGGVVDVLRQVSADAVPEISAALSTGPGALTVFGDAESRSLIGAALVRNGWTLAPDNGARGDAVAAAALHSSATALELVPATLVAERRRRERAFGAWLAVAAAALVVAAAGIALWGARRELSAIRSRRADIRPDVAPLLVLRDSLNRLTERASRIDSVASRAPRYTAALFDLALLLPPDAHLRAVHASGDTLRIEATGARAGVAMQALRDAESLRDLRLEGIVERELEDGTTAVERFTLRALLSNEPRMQASSSSAAAATRVSEVARRQP